ncbi:MAG: PQQ-dependent sugar dehydrogenase, partial [Saprospiraceae bacterium]|nr:PQQ-dependent sugar dehydrogenase [Saprospiraceae bacterium]
MKNLEIPWQMCYLGDERLIFSEKKGTINELNLVTESVKELYRFDSVANEVQVGLLGLAAHPDFPETPHIFATHTYYANDEIVMRVVRLNYNNERLHSPTIIIDKIPSFPISAGGRLCIGSDRKLYLTVGEGKYSESAQDPNDLSGKILRYNLDGSVPKDNPFSNNPVFALGMRNPQGIVQTSHGLFSTEHGNFSHDEINQLFAGANYGWPQQGGKCREHPDTCQQNSLIDPGLDWTPSVAPSGLAYYDEGPFKAWSNGLLIACLKGEQLKVVKLSEDGSTIVAQKSYLQSVLGRLRDVLVLPDGRVLVATSNKDVYGQPGAGSDQIIEIISGTGKWKIASQPKRIFNPLVKLDSTTLEVSVIAENLRLPWQMQLGPSGWIWFSERGGAIKKLNSTTGEIQLVHSIPNVYESDDNSGMHGFALHPSFPTEPFMYVHYCISIGESVLVRLEWEPETELITEQSLLKLEANKSHNGSRLVFGPDGMLYFCIGDAY